MRYRLPAHVRAARLMTRGEAMPVTMTSGGLQAHTDEDRRVADRRVSSAAQPGEARRIVSRKSAEAAKLNERLRHAAKVAFRNFGED